MAIARGPCLAASVAYHTVGLFNQQVDSLFRIAHPVSARVTQSLTCHGKGGIVENVHIISQTCCMLCHADLSRHPVPIR